MPHLMDLLASVRRATIVHFAIVAAITWAAIVTIVDPVQADAAASKAVPNSKASFFEDRLLMFPVPFLNKFTDIMERKDNTGLDELVRNNLETAQIVHLYLTKELFIFRLTGKLDKETSTPKSFIADCCHVLSVAIANCTNLPCLDSTGKSLEPIVRNPFELKKRELYRLSKAANKAFSESQTADSTLDLWQQALSTAKQVGDIAAQVYFHNGLAFINTYAGRKDKAKYHYDRFQSLRKSPYYKPEAKSNIEQIDVGSSANNHERRYFYEGESAGWCFDNAEQYYRAQNYLQAIKFWKKSLAQTDNKKYNRIFMCHRHIGICYLYSGQYQQALEHLNKAWEIVKKKGALKVRQLLLNEISAAYLGLGEYELALVSTQQSQRLSQKADNSVPPETIMQIGKIYSALGRYEEALEFLQKAMQMAINDRLSLESYVLDGYLETTKALLNTKHNPGEALSIAQETAIIALYMDHHRLVTDSLIMVAMVHRVHGFNLFAYHILQQALGCAKTLGNIEAQAITQYELASCLLPVDPKGKNGTSAGILLSRILQYREDGAFKGSLEEECYWLLSESVSLFEKAGNLEGLWRTHAAIARLRNDSRAIASFETAINIIESIRSEITLDEDRLFFDKGKLDVYNEYIRLLMRLHKKYPERKYDRKAFEIFERRQGRQFLEQLQKSGSVRFSGVPDEILRQERDTEQELHVTRSAMFNLMRIPSTESKAEFSKLQKKLTQIERDYKNLQEKIKDRYPQYFVLKHPKPVDISTLQHDVLSPGETIWIYKVLKDETILWVITPKKFETFSLSIGETELEKKVSAYRDIHAKLITDIEDEKPKAQIRRMAKRSLPKVQKQAADLFYLLVPSKLHAQLSSVDSLYIVPTGPLYTLPFEALIMQIGQKESQKPCYLVEACPVTYLSSASLLQLLRKTESDIRKDPVYPLIAFANPVYQTACSGATSDNDVNSLRTRSYLRVMGGSYPELPDTELEVREISSLLQAPINSHPLQVRNKASKSNVIELNEKDRLSHYRYIIFSCHGVIPDETNLTTEPALILSDPDPKTGQNGYLTMTDIFALNLNADLVTLSACNTGRGKLVKGEGVIGLTRAFMYAGTPTLTATLWSVESSSAKILSTGLFRGLKDGKGCSEALRHIKLAMIQGKEGRLYSHPYFWAPMVLFGDGR